MNSDRSAARRAEIEPEIIDDATHRLEGRVRLERTFPKVIQEMEPFSIARILGLETPAEIAVACLGSPIDWEYGDSDFVDFVLQKATERRYSQAIERLSRFALTTQSKCVWPSFDRIRYVLPEPFRDEEASMRSKSLPGLLWQLEVAHDLPELARLAEEIIGKAEQDRDAVVAALPRQALKLVKSNSLGAAAALEACGRLGISESLPAFEAALKIEDLSSFILQIAAQRIRLIAIEDSAMRSELGSFVSRSVEGWLRSGLNEAARDALPSVAFLQGTRCLSWLADLVGKIPDAEIVEASAHAACIVALGTDRLLRSEPVSEEQALPLLKEVIRRLSSDSKFTGTPEMVALARARLIEAIGVLGKFSPLEEVASMLAGYLAEAPAIERAAALRAARHLARSLGSEAASELLRATTEKGHDAAAKLLTLALQTNR
jgi:hypothetical protein